MLEVVVLVGFSLPILFKYYNNFYYSSELDYYLSSRSAVLSQICFPLNIESLYVKI